MDMLILGLWLKHFLWIFHRKKKKKVSNAALPSTRNVPTRLFLREDDKTSYNQSQIFMKQTNQKPKHFLTADIRFAHGTEGSTGSARVKITCELAVPYRAWARGVGMMLIHYSTLLEKKKRERKRRWQGLRALIWAAWSVCMDGRSASWP